MKEFYDRSSQNKKLKDKTAIITGGSSGIGRSISKLFASEGASVLVADIREKAREDNISVVDEITGSGGSARYVQTDVTSLSDLEDAFQEALNYYKKIDIVVNNAGVLLMKPITEVTEEEYNWLMDINVKGVYFGVKLAAKYMIKQKTGGSIINMSSVAGLLGFSGATTYCTSKGAVTNLTRAAAVELGPHGIRVNCINPGVIKTAMTTKDVNMVGKLEVPIGRDGNTNEVASAALFLASDQSSYVNGHTLLVDGGYAAQ